MNPIDSFEAGDGEDNAEDGAMPASMTFAFEATPTGSRMTSVIQFPSVEAMERTVPGMEEGLRAAMPQLDALLVGERSPLRTLRTDAAARGRVSGVGPG